ncbi:hypothetical protein SESBI_40075 [Sesbania bispinosa]|nr:hypothetical protein SESBI_40075 [Sesbania bispinosa]
MESTIRLCYYPLPSAPLNLSYGSKGSEYARATTFPHRFNHATLCLSHFSTSHQVACSFKHANCMLNRFSVPSKNEGSDSKILRGVTRVSLVLACVLGLFNFSSKMNHKFNTSYAMPMPHFSMVHNKVTTPEVGGEVALESLLNMINAETAEHFIPGFDHEPDKASVDALKLHAIHLSKSGKKDEALKILEKEYNKWKNSKAEQYLQNCSGRTSHSSGTCI